MSFSNRTTVSSPSRFAALAPSAWKHSNQEIVRKIILKQICTFTEITLNNCSVEVNGDLKKIPRTCKEQISISNTLPFGYKFRTSRVTCRTVVLFLLESLSAWHSSTLFGLSCVSLTAGVCSLGTSASAGSVFPSGCPLSVTSDFGEKDSMPSCSKVLKSSFCGFVLLTPSALKY